MEKLILPQWKELMSVETMYEGELIKGILQNAGIPARLIYQSLELLGVPLGATFPGTSLGICVQVPDENLEDAGKVLADMRQPRPRRIKYSGSFGRPGR